MTLLAECEPLEEGDRRVIRAASSLTLIFILCIVFFCLTDRPFDMQAREWLAHENKAAGPAATAQSANALAHLSGKTPQAGLAQLHALSCWYLPYTPHELLVARLKQAQPQELCATRKEADKILTDDAALLKAFDALGGAGEMALPDATPDAGSVLSTAISLEFARISYRAADMGAGRLEAVETLAQRLGLLRRIALSDQPISVRAAALQGMVYILRLAPVIVLDDREAARLFIERAGTALDELTIREDALEDAVRLQVAARVRKDRLEDAGASTLASELLVLKPVLYARLSMDLVDAALRAFNPDNPAQSLNRLRRQADRPLESLGAASWQHPVQATAMEPFLKQDAAIVVSYLIDLLQFNELRRMLAVHFAALDAQIVPEALAEYAAGQDETRRSTLTGRGFEVDLHSGDLVASPSENDTLAYTLRLYMGRGGGAMTADMIWPPVTRNQTSETGGTSGP